jgi:hypothetical protein
MLFGLIEYVSSENISGPRTLSLAGIGVKVARTCVSA